MKYIIVDYKITVFLPPVMIQLIKNRSLVGSYKEEITR